MRDPRLDELIQMETWDWWKAQVFYLREKKDYGKWYDILGDSGHAGTKEFDNMKPALMTTTGYVYSKDNKHLKTFASYDENEESFSDRNVFPIGCIKEMKKIEI